MEKTKVYIDTNIFIHTLFDNGFSPQKSRLKTIESGAEIGITSTLTILEIISVSRQILIEKTQRPLDVVNAEILEKIKLVFQTKNLTVVPIPENDQMLTAIFEDSLEHVKKYKGRVKNKDGRRGHKGMYAADVIHLAIALRYNCDKIITCDTNNRKTQLGLLHFMKMLLYIMRKLRVWKT